MSKRQSEITRFLNFYQSLGEEARKIVAEQVRDAFKGLATPRAMCDKGKKSTTIPADSQIKTDYLREEAAREESKALARRERAV